MELLLLRRPATDDAILGELFVDGLRQCWTLERRGVEIAAGRYLVTITPSQRFGRLLPLVSGVAGRSGIRIHSGNVPENSEGCILVGQTMAAERVNDSRLAMSFLQPKIARALAHGEAVHLTIQNGGIQERQLA